MSSGANAGIYADPNTKYVGIGTTAPRSKLDVVGDVRVAGEVRAAGGVRVEGDVVPGSCNVYDLGSAAARWRDLYLSGSTIDLGGTKISRSEEGGGLVIQSAEGGGLLDSKVSALYASNVGIGTTVATAPLHIHVTEQIITGPTGSLSAYPPSAMSSFTQTLSGAYGSGSYVLTQSSYASQRETWRAFDKIKTGDQYWSSESGYNISTGAYTGGNATTVSGVSVAGEWIQIQMPVSIALASYVISPRQDSQYALERRNARAWTLAGSTNGTTWVLLDSVSGKSWTTSADLTRTVTGAASYSYYRFIAQEVGNTGTGDNSGVAVAELVFNGVEGGSVSVVVSPAMTISSSTGAQLLAINSAGNVGIGVTAPVSALHVAGDVRLSGTLTASNVSVIGDYVTLNTVTSNTEQVVVTNAGTGPALKVTQTGAEAIAEFYDFESGLAMKVANGGYVGIGATNPSSPLHINTNANAATNGGLSSYALHINQYNSAFTELIGEASGIAFNRANPAAGHVGGKLLFISDGTGYGRGDFSFQLKNSGVNGDSTVEIMRIKNNGNVGIGTANPIQKLNVQGTILVSGNGGNLAYGIGEATYKGAIQIADGGNLTSDGGLEFKSSTSSSGYGWRIKTPDFLSGNTPLVFESRAASATWTERMRITVGGNMGIATTDPNEKLQINGNMSINGSIYNPNTTTLYGSTTAYASPVYLNIGYRQQTVGNGDGGRYVSAGDIRIKAQGLDWAIDESIEPKGGEIYIQGGRSAFGNPGGSASGAVIIRTYGATHALGYDRLTVYGIGTVALNAYGAGTLSTDASGVISASDGRFKTKTRSLDNGLSKVLQLAPTYYKWNEDSPWNSDHEELGFIAQEVSQVIPEASPDEEQEGKFKNYHDRALLAVAIKAIQELHQEITNLKGQIQTLTK